MPLSGVAAVEFTQVSAGKQKTCAVTSDKTVLCWGQVDMCEAMIEAADSRGQMKDVCPDGQRDKSKIKSFAEPTAAAAPTPEGSTIEWASIEVWQRHACGLDTQGVGYCWGSCNGYAANRRATDGNPCGGDLMNGVAAPSATAEGRVGGANNEYSWASLSVYSEQTCGVTLTNEGMCWGKISGNSGALGTANTAELLPALVRGGETWKKIATGSTNLGLSCGITVAGAMKCWGFDQYGGLGDGEDRDDSPAEPVFVLGNDIWEDVSVGGDGHVCGITSDQIAKCWGNQNSGRLGNGQNPARADGFAVHEPQLVLAGTTKFKQISAGYSMTCAVATDGEGYCWGENGEYADKWTSLEPALLPGGSKWVQISVGFKHACGVTEEKALLCWGMNDLGQLGNGGTGKTKKNQLLTPQAVVGSVQPATPAPSEAPTPEPTEAPTPEPTPAKETAAADSSTSGGAPAPAVANTDSGSTTGGAPAPVYGSITLTLTPPAGKTGADLAADPVFSQQVAESLAASLPDMNPEDIEIISITVVTERRALQATDGAPARQLQTAKLKVDYKVMVADETAAAAIKEELTTNKEAFSKAFVEKLEEKADVKVDSVEALAAAPAAAPAAASEDTSGDPAADSAQHVGLRLWALLPGIASALILR